MKLNISDGVKEYDLNGKCKIYFNPTDAHFIEQTFTLFNDLDAMHSEYNAKIHATKEDTEVFDICRRLDEELRSKIDGLLGEGVCTALFGSIYIFAASDGLPLWANLMLAIIDEMDDAFAREKKATNPRLQYYTKKYTRK